MQLSSFTQPHAAGNPRGHSKWLQTLKEMSKQTRLPMSLIRQHENMAVACFPNLIIQKDTKGRAILRILAGNPTMEI